MSGTTEETSSEQGDFSVMIKPMRDLVYIIPLEDRDKIGSIYVPDQAKQRVDQGIVKYRGPKTVDVRVGDHVIFHGYSGDELITEDEGLLYVMQEQDLIGTYIDLEGVALFTTDRLISFIDRTAGLLVAVDGFDQRLVSKLVERLRHIINEDLTAELHF